MPYQEPALQCGEHAQKGTGGSLEFDDLARQFVDALAKGSKFLAGYRIAQQHASEALHLSAQFVRCAHRADIVRHADELIQRRIQSVRVAGQPVADERQGPEDRPQAATPRRRAYPRSPPARGDAPRSACHHVGPLQAGRIPVNVATPKAMRRLRWEQSGRPDTARWRGEAGVVRSADCARGKQPPGVPDRGNQPQDRDTLALWAHNPEQGRRAGALSTGESRSTQAAAYSISVAGREDDDRRLAACGCRCARIAEELGRAASTVSRELRRNADDQGRYLPATAERLTVERQSRSRTRRLARDEQLCGVVAELLGKRWSPEQVAHELPVRFPDQPERHLCTESIYQAIYDPRTDLTRPAKRRRRRRRRRVQGLERRGRLTAMTMIADRPAEVTDRVQVGHWEGDCIMGAGNRSAIGTLVERVTRFLILIHVPTGRPTAEAMRDSVAEALGALAPHLRRTLTWDQGKELALHQQITARTGIRVFFCDAHSPWQRGSNENMNGLLRDYFPKGIDLAHISPAELQRVADELNDRPRKTLGWARPADLITDAALKTA